MDDLQLFQDLWAFFLKYNNPSDNRLFWENMVAEASELTSRHSGQLAVDLFVAVMAEIERKFMEQNNG